MIGHKFYFPTCTSFCMLIIGLFGLLPFGDILMAQDASTHDSFSEKSKNGFAELSNLIEKKRIEHQIPGMAVAIVHKDKILLLRTFGYRDIDRKKPVSSDTVFPIGSSTKPFTSTLAAMLVTDGTMSWDEPVIKYLPYFKLKIKSDNESDQVTVRDLLSHRTGHFTMDLIQKAINWEQDPDFESRNGSKRYTRESLLRAAAEYEPKDFFRKKHNYSNIGMLAAAMSAGVASGRDWDTLMEERMFKPLNMTHSSTSITSIKKGHDVAIGYVGMEGELSPAVLINMDVISPAGGINSTIVDMAQWLRLLLSEGVYDGKRLIGKNELLETWAKQIGNADIGGMLPGASYGMGWFITKWKGRRVVEHAGNALGYSANVALIPDEEIGYAMLSNCMTNPRLLNEDVWDALLGDGKE